MQTMLMLVAVLGAVTATGVADPTVNGVTTSTFSTNAATAAPQAAGSTAAAVATRGSDAPTDFSRNGIGNRTAAPSGTIADATIEAPSTCESLGSNCNACLAARCYFMPGNEAGSASCHRGVPSVAMPTHAEHIARPDAGSFSGIEGCPAGAGHSQHPAQVGANRTTPPAPGNVGGSAYSETKKDFDIGLVGVSIVVGCMMLIALATLKMRDRNIADDGGFLGAELSDGLTYVGDDEADALITKTDEHGRQRACELDLSTPALPRGDFTAIDLSDRALPRGEFTVIGAGFSPTKQFEMTRNLVSSSSMDAFELTAHDAPF